MGNKDTLYTNLEPILIDGLCIGNICPPQICMLRKMGILRNLAFQEKLAGIIGGMNSGSDDAQGTTSGNIKKRSDFFLKIIFSSLYIKSQMFENVGCRNFYQDILQRKLMQRTLQVRNVVKNGNIPTYANI